MKEILHKHVKLGMANSHIIEGFVSEFEDKYIKLVDYGNDEYIIKIEDISFAHIKSGSPHAGNPLIKKAAIDEDFNMTMAPENTYQSQFELIKKMK